MQAGDGEGRFGPTDQHQRTPQISRLYLVIFAVTIGGKVDTAGTGVVGNFELSTVAPLDKINPPFPYVVVLRKQRRYPAHCGIQERCT